MGYPKSRTLILVLLLILLGGCSGLSSRNPVPEPVPDHGPPTAAATLDDPAAITLRTNLDLFQGDPRRDGSYPIASPVGFPDVMHLNIVAESQRPITDQNDVPIVFPFEASSGLPAYHEMKFYPGTGFTITFSITVIHVPAGSFLQCQFLIKQGSGDYIIIPGVTQVQPAINLGDFWGVYMTCGLIP